MLIHSVFLLCRHRERSAAIHVSCIKDIEILHMDCHVANAPRSDGEPCNNPIKSKDVNKREFQNESVPMTEKVFKVKPCYSACSAVE